MSYNNEYRNAMAGGNGCSYKSLGNYSGCNSTMAPIRAGAGANAMVVPTYGAIGYAALTHGNSAGSCGGHFNIQSAYGAGAGNCSTAYTTRLCGGCGNKGGN